MHFAFERVRRRIALLQTGGFVVVRFIARSDTIIIVCFILGGVASVGRQSGVPIFGWDGCAMRLVSGRGC